MSKHFSTFAALIILALASAGCAPYAGSDADVAGVQAWADAMLAAQTAGDVDASMALLTDAAVGMQPDGSLLADADAWRSYWEGFYSQGGVEAALSDEEIQAGGDWGSVSGAWNVTITPAEGGEPVQGSSHFIVIVHREADGAWKLARVIWHAAQPASAEE